MCVENPHDVLFTLVCSNCDTGMQIVNHEQAIAEGWTEIEFAPDLPMASWLGYCPECQKVDHEINPPN